jgi:ADP-dependent NAD(P)H-hydrate dehydratase / NAD(P)H-hydrate epimerase
MKPVVTPKHMAELDQYAIAQLAIPGLILMENAGRGIAETALNLLAHADRKLVHIFCGPGHNGGDGYVVARHLLNHGCQVELFVLAERDKISGDSLVNLLILEKMGQPVHFIHQLPQAGTHQPALIIDALLGTGASSPVKDLYAQMIDHLNQQPVPILAVDLPTGINAETGAVAGPAIQATVTCTMAMAKTGLLLSPAREAAGEVKVVDISLPAQALAALPPAFWQLEQEDIRARLPVRPRDAFKNQVGTAAIVAGSLGFCGAAALTAQACLRSGAGLCYLAFPASLNTVMASKLTEVVLWPMPDEQLGFLTLQGKEELLARINSQTACAIGPGLGQSDQTSRLVISLLKALDLPLVLDADGLNICSQEVAVIAEYPAKMVLTPHPGELARLMKMTSREISHNRIAVAQRASHELRQVVVLKGSPTLIAAPDGAVYLNTTGNAGMATAGSGDVLTGVITALLAQGLSSLDAAMAGVFIHGLAGDLAKRQMGEESLLAGDIMANLADALRTIKGMA